MQAICDDLCGEKGVGDYCRKCGWKCQANQCCLCRLDYQEIEVEGVSEEVRSLLKRLRPKKARSRRT